MRGNDIRAKQKRKFIEVFYKRSRRHSSLGYLARAEFETIILAA